MAGVNILLAPAIFTVYNYFAKHFFDSLHGEETPY